MPPRRKQRQAPDLETNTNPDAGTDDLRRRDPSATPPDSLPPRESGPAGRPVGGGLTPAEDRESCSPSVYEREINRLDSVTAHRIA